MTEEKCKLLFSSRYDGDFTFAFDNIEDYDLIESKLKMIQKYQPKKKIKFYVLCGFRSVGLDDIENTFRRIELLFKYNAIPYIMRYQAPGSAPWKSSPYDYMYVQLARWCNQTSIVKKKSFREWGEIDTDHPAAERARARFEKEQPEIAKRYFDMKCGFAC